MGLGSNSRCYTAFAAGREIDVLQSVYLGVGPIVFDLIYIPSTRTSACTAVTVRLIVPGLTARLELGFLGAVPSNR